jgi:hypothetical protein
MIFAINRIVKLAKHAPIIGDESQRAAWVA